MKNGTRYIALIGICSCCLLSATMGQDRQTVEQAIVAMEGEFEVRFSYSKELVPYDSRVQLVFEDRTLPEVLRSFRDQTGIEYRQRGRRVMLKYIQPTEPEPTEAASPSPDDEPETKEEQDPIGYQSMGKEEGELAYVSAEERQRQEAMQQGAKPVVKLSNRRDPREVMSQSKEREAFARLQEAERIKLAQFTFLPFVPKRISHKADQTYHLSLNAIAGFNGGIEGLEIGGLINGTRAHVRGVQVAGVANYVGDDVRGGQVSGLANVNRGVMRGIQMAGFANINEQADAIQLAGAFNFNKSVSRGMQLAGLFNIGRQVAGSQVSGFFNFSLGQNEVQLAGLLNIAEKTDVQMSGILNVAKQVDYLQLGLINVADTVGGASFGLLNLIRRGYNRLEFSVSESMYANMAIKLGTRHFYNIFQISSNFRRTIERDGMVWGYGYGLGFFHRLDANVRLNPELLVMNVNERRALVADLNLLTQVKLLFHFSKLTKTEFFAGPAFNLAISEIHRTDTGLYGTEIPPYAIWEQTSEGAFNTINTKFWIGFSAGIRI